MSDALMIFRLSWSSFATKTASTRRTTPASRSRRNSLTKSNGSTARPKPITTNCMGPYVMSVSLLDSWSLIASGLLDWHPPAPWVLTRVAGHLVDADSDCQDEQIVLPRPDFDTV